VSSFRIVGPGRAGRAFATSLEGAGWTFAGFLGRDDDLTDAAKGVDLLILATPDASIRDVAAAVEPVDDAVVAHVAGSLGLSVLEPHARRAGFHPLVTLPSGPRGASNLTGGRWFAVAGDPVALGVVADLGGRPVAVADEDRVLYHATACVAANHLVALMGQVERLAGLIDVPFDAYLDLASGAFADVVASGPAAALTGPAARGDDATLAAHLMALPAGERAAYEVLSQQARTLRDAT
jgi:predicted short-subunit dehydrogenase-like oxidoreductase (DUF2520 family)